MTLRVTCNLAEVVWRPSPEEISKLEGRAETVVTVGSMGPRRRELGLLFWILMAVDPTGISTRLRGKLAESGGEAHMHERTLWLALRGRRAGSSPRARRGVHVHAVASDLPSRGRARTSVCTCARGLVGGWVWVDGEELYARVCRQQYAV